MPKFNSYLELWQATQELTKLDKFPYQTVVLDSLTKLDELVKHGVIDKFNKGLTDDKKVESLSKCGEWGSGYSRALNWHISFKRMLESLRKFGVTIIYIAHLDEKTTRHLDGDDYHTHSLRMAFDKSRSLYIDDVDAVFFAKQKVYVSVSYTDKAKKTVKKAIASEATGRIIETSASFTQDSKNRFRGMPDQLPMDDIDEILKYIPYYNQKEKNNDG